MPENPPHDALRRAVARGVAEHGSSHYDAETANVVSHTRDEAAHQPTTALRACDLNNGQPCASCAAEFRARHTLSLPLDRARAARKRSAHRKPRTLTSA